MSSYNYMNSSLYHRLSSAPDDTLLDVVEHLTEARFFDKLHKLIEPSFMWAKRVRYESHNNFIQDLERTIGALQNDGLDGLPRLMFYSMLDATLRSMTINITPEVLRIMAALGEMKRAITFAETLPDPYQKALAFQILGRGGERAQEKERTQGVQRRLNRELIQRSFSESLQIDRSYAESKFWSTLASDLARVGDMEAALSCAEQIDRDEPYNRKSRTLENIAVELALGGKKSEAFQVYEQLENEYSKTVLLKDLVTALAKAGLIIDVLNIVITMEESEDVVQSIARVWQVRQDKLQETLDQAKEMQDLGERTKTLLELASIIDSIQQDILMKKQSGVDPYESAKASKSRALLLIWLGRYDDSLNILKTLDDLKNADINMHFLLSADYEFDGFLKGLLILNRFEDAEYLVENGWTSSPSTKMLSIWEEMQSSLTRLIKQGDLDGVFAAIEMIEPKEHQADAMLLVGPQLAKLGRMKDIVEFYEKNRDDGHFDYFSHQLAAYLSHQGMFMEADSLMGGFLDDSVRFTYLVEVAGSLISLDRHIEIWSVIKRHERKISERLEDLALIAEKLAPLDIIAAREILELGLIDSEEVELTFEDRADIFAFAATALTHSGHIEKVVEIANHFAREKPDFYSEIISEAIAKSLDPSQAQSLLAEVLEFVESIPDEPDQTLYLARQTVLNYLVGSLARRDQFEHAITVTSRMDENFWQKPLAFAELAGRLAAKDKKRAEIFLDHATNIIRKRKDSRGKKSSGYSFLIPNVLPLFLVPANARIGKWIMLSPKVGPLGGLVEIEEGTGMTFIATELLMAGWVEKALEIAKKLKVEAIKLQIQTYAATLMANRGNTVDARKLLDGSDDINPNIDYVKSLGYESSDPKMMLRTAEFQSRIEKGDIKGARKLAKDLIDRIDNDNLGKVSRVLAFAFLTNGLVDELLYLLKLIPNALTDKIEIQIACIWYFIDEHKYSIVENIIATIEDENWKALLENLVEMKKVSPDNQEQLHQNLIRFITNATEIEQLTKTDAITSWLSKQIAEGLILFSEINETSIILNEIPDLDFRFHIMSETSTRLVRKGLIEDAHQIFQEIGEQKIRDTTVTLIVDELANLDPTTAIHGFLTFLHDLIDKGFKSFCHAVSHIIPLAYKMAGPDRSSELIWEIYKEIIRVDGFWEKATSE